MAEIQFTIGDPDKDFFEQNPHWKYLDSSLRAIKEFGPKLASKLRWAVFLIEDPDSPYFRYPKDKRVSIVDSNYLKKDYDIDYDSEKQEVLNEELKFLWNSYPSDTMSKLKRDYYEREMSYQMLIDMERTSNVMKDRADTQIKLAKIYEELSKAKQAFEKENEEEKVRSRGKMQPGILFT